MKIPGYIENALQRRAKYAKRLWDASNEVDEFLRKNGIDEEIELCDMGSGSEVYCAPYESADRVREAILAHKK